jgi:sec-independent protein translocase protein TatA
VFNIGPTELIVILIVALIVFGPKRLPEIGRTLGRSLNEFRRASSDLRRELEVDVKDEPASGAGAPSTTSDAVAPAAQAGEQPPVSHAAQTDPARESGPNGSNPQG